MKSFQLIYCLSILLLGNQKYVLSDEPLSQRVFEERLYEKMIEIDLKVQKALEKMDTTDNDKERQKDHISSLVTSGRPVLQVKELEKDGWEMIFRATSSNGQSVFDAWTKGVGTCSDKPTSMERSYSSNYRHSMVPNWKNIGVKYVKYAYYENNQEVAYVIFNAAGSDMNSWFDKRRVLASSYSDLTASQSFNHFSIAGDYRPNSLERRFLINTFYNGCDKDYGHMVISENEPPNTCNWDKHPKYPQFLYSKINSFDYWGRQMFGRADYMAIFIKTG